MLRAKRKSDTDSETQEREITWEELKHVIRNMMRAGVEENIRKNKEKEKIKKKDRNQKLVEE